jgi:hypothetical protein
MRNSFLKNLYEALEAILAINLLKTNVMAIIPKLTTHFCSELPKKYTE